MITIVNYESGNVASIANMLKKLTVKHEITDDISKIENANKIILPGVGSYDTAIKKLHQKNLFKIIKKKIFDEEIYILGICLGMQLMCYGSEEGKEKGFGYFNHICQKFKDNENTKKTFMGWSKLKVQKPHKIFSDIKEDNRFYFLHSFFYPIEKDETYSITSNGYDFSSVIIKNKKIGAQFHPERSHFFGMKILKNFSNL